jgi:hypothetical protein
MVVGGVIVDPGCLDKRAQLSLQAHFGQQPQCAGLPRAWLAVDLLKQRTLPG